MNQPRPQEHFFKTAFEKASSDLALVILHFRKNKPQSPFLFEEKYHTGTSLALGEHIFFTEEEKCRMKEVLPAVCEDTVLQYNSIQYAS